MSENAGFNTDNKVPSEPVVNLSAGQYETWHLDELIDEQVSQVSALSSSEQKTLIPPSAKEIECIRQAAFEEGKSQGFEKGRVEGLKAGTADVEIKLAEATQFITVLNQSLQEQDRELERSLVALSAEIARSIIRRELKIDSTTLVSLVNEVLSFVDEGLRQVKVYLNPDDLLAFKAYLEKESNTARWHLLENRSLSPGGCFVETATCHLDLTVENRIKLLVDKIYDADEKSEMACEQALISEAKVSGTEALEQKQQTQKDEGLRQASTEPVSAENVNEKTHDEREEPLEAVVVPSVENEQDNGPPSTH